ncbi:MAG: hypothetical protein A3H57_00705 [Candidatus Taylorbacteria bacterium RIFCSPLOWO2_02_FULL_43_11]|uniref:Transcription regulator TrmB N-terminal domain-containing protein n=1 Tax=Candidatus Taylorbacteria bacterium RIFCSPHIGHO2_02_FULL_43_32b TaxID=1802306 RepID=A0A1G2MHN6_9BACT|nr:MAG: hypothetical protein A2743_01610 [Candidatus Taylorbacteria bacterium RIFCSPHIGHO2_01_FULL_43_47]OHA23440.1 MAG: hypothetical protein A3C72_03700 [Candidatus Taylorbacteria bacterium RIFCSPHIGHO2_02_FULL_43_32b]OHA30456.1 MAG: hypothetical protein A3B08_02715 [Candidatus Taylorbacteria bacterium RIFCSPLOWO2_01_FULL_43_44]OHA36997.1 MAG: hypothetical protein A3H57_00705 [Candidatus Taylorbacteria bacterium RIFCSPLOWO2_02_FULL_43_11]
MDNKEIIESLEEYGFTRNESQIYVFLLKQIEATAFEISKSTRIPRATVYVTLESLTKQGFVSQSRKNNVANFSPESPNRLLHLLRKKEGIVQDIMPQIRALTSRPLDAPVAKLFVGLEGVKTGLENILETLRDQKIKRIYATSQPDLMEYLPKYFPSWLKDREKLGVYTELILPYHAADYLKSNELREVRFLPDKFPFTSSVTIYGNKMAFFSLSERDAYCVVIESNSISEMFRQFFLFAWEMLGGSGRAK